MYLTEGIHAADDLGVAIAKRDVAGSVLIWIGCSHDIALSQFALQHVTSRHCFNRGASPIIGIGIKHTVVNG